MRSGILNSAKALVGAFALCAGCATNPGITGSKARGHSDQAAVASHDEAGNKDEIVCRTETRAGSHMRKRVCRKQSEIDADRAAVQSELLNKSTRRAVGGPQ